SRSTPGQLRALATAQKARRNAAAAALVGSKAGSDDPFPLNLGSRIDIHGVSSAVLLSGDRHTGKGCDA
ncbi:MAG: hypothetical protein ACRECU_02695, partial [Methylocella sp.]